MKHVRDQLIAAPTHVTGYIDGAFAATDGADIAVSDPATGKLTAILHESDAGTVDRAVTAARRAFTSGPWAGASVAVRQKALHAVHDAILEHADELAALETLDTGIPYTQTRNVHIPRAAHNFKFFAEFINQDGGEVFTQEQGYMSLVTYEPIGVTALIGPWNMPLGLTAMKMAGALAFGNTCVVKPSELTPLTLHRLFQIIDQKGIFPKGVVNLVNGNGAVTGNALSAHPDIDMVSFTGGTETGARILSALAKGIKGGAMELGGKSASIVFDDADFDRALDGAMLGSFMNNGQMCLAGSRLFVHESLADRFVEGFARRVKALRVGDPFDPATEIGPMINRAQMDRVIRYAESGIAEGAKLLAGGKVHDELKDGFFIEPTAMLATSNALSICQEEIFAPFATIQTFSDEDDVVSRANDSRFGLVGYLWTQNLERALRVAAGIKTGTVLINTPIMRDLRTGFGGIRQSGIGREGAKGSRAMFTEMKSTIIALSAPNMPRMGEGA